MEHGYSLIKQIKIYNSDPICSIDLNEEVLLFGTMLGYCGYYLIPEEKFIKISDREDEHICSTQIKKNKLYIGVGDEKMMIVEKNPNKKILTEIQNYEDDSDHFKVCEKTYSMVKDNFIFLIELKITKDDDKIATVNQCDWTIKNFDNKKSFHGRMDISNFWAPLDFNGKNLIFVEFLNDKKRFFDIYSFYHEKFLKKINLKKHKENIGHISHAKFCGEEKIFLVHSYKICQIRDMNFKLIKEFEHDGNEIIAIDIYINKKGNIEVILLDINCDVFIYKEKDNNEKYLFNLHKLDCIEEQIKQQKFFSMGYPYYIKFNKKFIAVTTDQGCFLLKEE